MAGINLKRFKKLIEGNPHSYKIKIIYGSSKIKTGHWDWDNDFER